MSRTILAVFLSTEYRELLAEQFAMKELDIIACDDMIQAERALLSQAFPLVIVYTPALAPHRAQEALQQIRMATYAPIIVLASIEIAELLFEAGADVCLPHDASPEVVLIQTMALIRRYTLYNHYDISNPDAAILYRGNLMIDPIRHHVTLAGEEIMLQRREFRLLHYFARNPGIVLTPEQICEKVWQTEHSYNRDVSPVISQLRRKLKDNKDSPKYIETIHGVGYRFIPDK